MAFQGRGMPTCHGSGGRASGHAMGLNFGRNIRNGTIGGVARAATHSRCNSPSSFCKISPAGYP
jgi:hypothetical protein